MSDTRTHQLLNFNYYPTVSTLVGAENADLNGFIYKSKKSYSWMSASWSTFPTFSVLETEPHIAW